MRLAGVLVLIVAVSVSACRKEEGPAERAGREIDEAMKDSSKKVNEAAKTMGEAMQRAGEQIGEASHEMGKAMEDAAKKARETPRP